MKRLFTVLMVGGLLAVAAERAQAVNVLLNGDFENAAGVSPDFPGWDVDEFVAGNPGQELNPLHQQGFANDPNSDPGGAFGAWLRPFVGDNDGVDMHTGVLSQTVAATEGETYTFSGYSRFEAGYSGGLDELSGEPEYPDPIPSPTETLFTLEFLDSLGATIGTPQTLDVRTSRETHPDNFLGIANNNQWYDHSLISDTAPMGTASVRVSAGGYDMMFSKTEPQSAMLDNFSLTGALSPGTELLTNADLNTGPAIPPELEHWTLVEVGGDTAGQGTNFADNPNSPGDFGYWVKAFNDGDSTLSQRVEASEGEEFDFSAWAAFGQNYSGGTDGTKPSTVTLLEVAFLDANEEEIGTPVTLDLWDEGLRNASGGISATPEAWEQFSIDGQIAPAGTAFVEVRTVVTGAFETAGADMGAFFDDYVLMLASATIPGDHNGDGTVDAADYALWRSDPSAFGNAQGYTDWVDNFGATAGSGGANLLSAAGAVPEPASCTLALVALLAGVALRRGRRSGTVV